MTKKNKKIKKHRKLWLFLKLLLVICLLVVSVVVLYFGIGYGSQIQTLRADAIEKVNNSTKSTFRATQTSVVYDADGELISTLKGEKDLYYLESEKIPYFVKAAFVSVEDKKFFRHNGIDIKAILRAAKSIVQKKAVTQGGSTITQQLSRNVFLTHEVSWERKVAEIFISLELEKKYTKDDILEYYINNIYFANGYYGIEAASKGYFNVEVKELSLSQIAFLSAIPNNPTIFDPIERSENTIKRRNLILKEMLESNRITQEEYNEAIKEDMTLNRPEVTKENYVETYTYYCATRALMEEKGFQFQTVFASDVEKEKYLDEYNELYVECQKTLFTAGYRIYTSIDMDKQGELQLAIDENLEEFTTVNEDGTFDLQGAATCIDNNTGLVVAVVGGRTQDTSGYTLNRAYQSFRQPGSAIKPLIVYGPILEGDYTPNSTVVDEEIIDGPSNYSGSYGGSMTLRKAVEQSKNTVAWKLFQELTPRVGLSYLENMNFSKLHANDYNLAASLGGFTNGVNTVEMASAYEAIENDGNFRSPTCIIEITDADGNILIQGTSGEKNIYRENAARMMTDVLKTVMTSGTGKGLGLTNMPSAGKTGTTNDNKDGWFVGFTRYYTTSVWVGFDMPKELPGLTGATYPGTIWNQFMEGIHEDLETMDFIPYASYSVPLDNTVDERETPDEVDPIVEEELESDIEQEDDEEKDNEDNKKDRKDKKDEVDSKDDAIVPEEETILPEEEIVDPPVEDPPTEEKPNIGEEDNSNGEVQNTD